MLLLHLACPGRPSASSARSASAWDVVDRPRLSLQVLKESVLDRAAQYMSMPTSPTSASSKRKNAKDGHRRRDAKEHAREIVRQAKETVTNRNKSGGAGKKTPSTANCNKENACPLLVEDKKMVVHVQTPAASVKPTVPLAARVQSEQLQPHAPRLPPPPPPVRAKPSRPPPPPPPPEYPRPTRAAPPPLSPQAAKCKRPPDGCERFATRIKKPGAGAGAATIQQAAPAAQPCPAPAAPVNISIGHHHHQRSHPAVASTSSSRASVPLEEDPEYGYLRSVLERGGFMRTTPPPSQRPFKGHSVTPPVDPIVFHLLELDLPMDESPRLGPLRHRWNRKLMFHLTQEILADLLLDGASSGTSSVAPLHGPALLAKVWSKVKSFPAADCRVVGDIDALVEADLRATSSVRGLVHHPAVAEEAGDVADDVAEHLLDALLRESLPTTNSWSWSPARASR